MDLHDVEDDMEAVDFLDVASSEVVITAFDERLHVDATRRFQYALLCHSQHSDGAFGNRSRKRKPLPYCLDRHALSAVP